MAYLKPNVFTAKVFNKIAMSRGIGGAETLTVRGRRTGNPQQIPVVPVEIDGQLFLVCPRGETEWVRNTRVNPEVSITNRSGTRSYHAAEVPIEERGRVIDAYRKKAGRTVDAYWKKLPAAKDHPVFRLS